MYKNIIVATAAAWLFILFSSLSISAQSLELTLFYGQGCSHCAKVESYIAENDVEDLVDIIKKEVYFNPVNASDYNDTLATYGVPAADRGVPTLVTPTDAIIGDGPIILYLAELINNPEFILAETTQEVEAIEPIEDDKLSIPVVIGASLVDAINPCAFAVLLILLSTVIAGSGSRKRILVSGVAFSLSIFISYVLMGLGVYAALGSLESTNVLTNIVGYGAIILGLFNLKDWLWYGKFFKVEVPQSWRPKMRSFIVSVTSPTGAFLSGLVVSLFLLPCTSGPYIVILGLLAESSFDTSAVGYLLLYNIIFVSPMLLITLFAYKGADVAKINYIREANLERLHLVAGIILLALGLYVVL